MTTRRYRVRVYDDGAEVLTDRVYEAVLDLTGPAGLREAETKLDELVITLARQDGAPARRVHRYYLAIHDKDTGQLELHWPAKDIDY
jgi:hypothetical protein